MKKLAPYSLVLSALASASAQAAVALDPMAINTKIVPSVSLVTMQDSNIYMASGNEVSSSIL